MKNGIVAVCVLVLALVNGGCATTMTYKGREVLRTEISPRGVVLELPQSGTKYEYRPSLDWLLDPELTVDVERSNG